MSDAFVRRQSMPDLGVWNKLKGRRRPVSFDLEITARCNNNCRHCYINLPATDQAAQARELTFAEIERIADEAVAMGALWCLITGGEPLLRGDFADIYLMLRSKGLLVNVFTNACLVTPEHAELFRRYPPRDIEVTVYGATRETYERVTRCPGSYAAFMCGLDLLLSSGVQLRLKAVALRANVHELDAISAFCRARTKDYYRFDPLLHLRFDGDERRNAEIREERLSPADIVAVESADVERMVALHRDCDQLIRSDADQTCCDDRVLRCGAGIDSFNVGYDGTYRLCSSLWHPDATYDLRAGTLAAAWEGVLPRMRELRSCNAEFLAKCGRCGIVDLCLWCPAHSALETGNMDEWIEYFCAVAHERARAIGGGDTHEGARSEPARSD